MYNVYIYTLQKLTIDIVSYGRIKDKGHGWKLRFASRRPIEAAR